MYPDPRYRNPATSSGFPSPVRSIALKPTASHREPWVSFACSAGYHPPALGEYANTRAVQALQQEPGMGWCSATQIAVPPAMATRAHAPVQPGSISAEQAVSGPAGVTGGPTVDRSRAPTGSMVVPTGVGLVVGDPVAAGFGLGLVLWCGVGEVEPAGLPPVSTGPSDRAPFAPQAAASRARAIPRTTIVRFMASSFDVPTWAQRGGAPKRRVRPRVTVRSPGSGA